MFLEKVYMWFWTPAFWLPNNLNWTQLQDTEHAKYPQNEFFYQSFVAAFFLWLIQPHVHKYLLVPLAGYCGLESSKSRFVKDNEVLKTAFQNCKKLNHKTTEELAKKLDWGKHQVEQWFRKRQQQDHSSKLNKFCESSWRALFHSLTLIYFSKYFWNNEWVWNIKECWNDYPPPLEQHVKWWFYIHMPFCVLDNIHIFISKPKEFWLMVAHHLITFTLISFVWITNEVRLGSVVILIFKPAEICLQLAKVACYLKSNLFENVISVIFVAVWLLSRFCYSFIVYSVFYEYPWHVPYLYFVKFLLGVLLMMQIFWTYKISKVVYAAIMAKQYIKKDYRSETEEDSSSE